ncbi:hypothetical protein OBBRIDRAFT_827907, partial [Obba rivulosa]
MIMRSEFTGADALAHIISALEIMKEASGAVPVPILSPIIGSILSIVQTVEKLKGDKKLCVRLARRALDLAERVQETISAEIDAVDGQLAGDLAKLLAFVSRIQVDLGEWSREKAWMRAVRRGTLSELLDEHFDGLEVPGARSLYALSMNALHKKLNAQSRQLDAQALYDPMTQLDVRDAWEGEYNGNKVIVRRCHPNVMRIFGYSHPDEYSVLLCWSQVVHVPLRFV